MSEIYYSIIQMIEQEKFRSSGQHTRFVIVKVGRMLKILKY